MAAAGYWKMRRLWGQGWEDKISLTINNIIFLGRVFLTSLPCCGTPCPLKLERSKELTTLKKPCKIML